MHNLLGNRGVDAHQLRSEKIAAWHAGHSNELTILFVISFDGNRQVNAVKHLTGNLQHQTMTEVLRKAETGLDRIRIVVISGRLRNPPVGLAGARYDAESTNISLAERYERQFAQRYAVSPQRLCRLRAVRERTRLKTDELASVDLESSGVKNLKRHRRVEGSKAGAQCRLAFAKRIPRKPNTG